RRLEPHAAAEAPHRFRAVVDVGVAGGFHKPPTPVHFGRDRRSTYEVARVSLSRLVRGVERDPTSPGKVVADNDVRILLIRMQAVVPHGGRGHIVGPTEMCAGAQLPRIAWVENAGDLPFPSFA